MLVGLFMTYRVFDLDARRTSYLLVPALSLLVVGVYRVVQTFSTNASDPVRSLAAFWVLQITFELCVVLVASVTFAADDGEKPAKLIRSIAYMSYLVISLPGSYPRAVTPQGPGVDLEQTWNNKAEYGVGNGQYGQGYVRRGSRGLLGVAGRILDA